MKKIPPDNLLIFDDGQNEWTPIEMDGAPDLRPVGLLCACNPCQMAKAHGKGTNFKEWFNL